MPERRALVIGSQCERLPPLSFLPGLAEELYSVLTDPALGECLPETADGRGLLLNPTAKAAYEAIDTALERAATDDATLLFAWIGHGEHLGDDFLLLPFDAPARLNSRNAIDPIGCISDGGRYGWPDGLIVLIDACYAGFAAAQAGSSWSKHPPQGLRFSLLTAVADTVAADGCFTRHLIQMMREGVHEEPGERLQCQHLRAQLKVRCRLQEPLSPTLNEDSGLYVSRNAAWLKTRRAWISPRAEAMILRLTANYQPTPVLDRIVEASSKARLVNVVGVAGCGKSALAAALARPEVTRDRVPDGFVTAVAFLDTSTISMSLAYELSEQLARAAPDFQAAKDLVRRETPAPEFTRMEVLDREIVTPLRFVKRDRQIRIVLDGLDGAAAAAESIGKALDTIASDPELDHVRIVVTAREDTPLPPGTTIPVGDARDTDLRQYLRPRVHSRTVEDAIVARAAGNWLVASLLADINPETKHDELPDDLISIYALALRGAGGANTDRWQTELRPVLSTLAAAGSGPVVPLKLLCNASGRLDGPSTPRRVRDVMVKLPGLVVRASAGTEQEHAGLFHRTFSEYLLDPEQVQFGLEPSEAHRALADAIDELAPPRNDDPRDPLHRYAAAAEASHLWECGKRIEAVASLIARERSVPAENLRRWREWLPKIVDALGPEHPAALQARAALANAIGQAGDAAEATRKLQDLLAEFEEQFGVDDVETVTVEGAIAHWTGLAGNPREALRLLTEVLAASAHGVSADDPVVLRALLHQANWQGASGQAQIALTRFQELVPRFERVRGPRHRDTLRARGALAEWTGRAGNPREALRLAQDLLRDAGNVFGSRDPLTLQVKGIVAMTTGVLGGVSEALEQYTSLARESVEVFGPDHPVTLDTHGWIAHWTGQTGHPREALKLFVELKDALTGRFGKDYPVLLVTRFQIALWTLTCGGIEEAIRQLDAILPDSERVFGLRGRENLGLMHARAAWTSMTGNFDEARDRMLAVAEACQETLGADSVETLLARSTVALLTVQSGQVAAGSALYDSVLKDAERLFGPDHEATSSVQAQYAHALGMAGDPVEALRRFNTLLERSKNLSEVNPLWHSSVRTAIAFWTGRSGYAWRAVQLCMELLAEQESRSLNHPVTLLTRASLGEWMMQAGQLVAAADLFRGLLPLLESVYGADHPQALYVGLKLAGAEALTQNSAEARRLYEDAMKRYVGVQGATIMANFPARVEAAVQRGQSGDVQGAAAQLRQIVDEMSRTLGTDHPSTLEARVYLAGWISQSGNAPGGLLEMESAVSSAARVFGAANPQSFRIRLAHAGMIAYTGNPAEALRMGRELLRDVSRVLGPAHETTFQVRIAVAQAMMGTGDGAGALREFTLIGREAQAALGLDHPGVLEAKNAAAALTGQSGNPSEASRMFTESIPNIQKRFGPDHPHVLSARQAQAFWTAQAGDSIAAQRLAEALLADAKRLLGPRHLLTFQCRELVAGCTGGSGDAPGARRLASELVADLHACWNPGHPSAFSARQMSAFWAAQAGDTAGAIRELDALHSDVVRAFGAPHPVAQQVAAQAQTLRSQKSGWFSRLAPRR